MTEEAEKGGREKKKEEQKRKRARVDRSGEQHNQ
jgi:hypothetical protein